MEAKQYTTAFPQCASRGKNVNYDTGMANRQVCYMSVAQSSQVWFAQDCRQRAPGAWTNNVVSRDSHEALSSLQHVALSNYVLKYAGGGLNLQPPLK